jgi:hypothetical protein
MALALVALAPPAAAKTFTLLRSAGASRIIIDPAGVEQAPGTSVRRVWTVTVQPNMIAGPPPQPGYVRSQNEYDCAAGTMRWRSFTAFSRSGTELVTRKNPSQDWIAVTPTAGSLGEWRVVCGVSRGDSAVEADTVAQLVVALMAAFDPAPALPIPTAPPPKATKPAKPTKG